MAYQSFNPETANTINGGGIAGRIRSMMPSPAAPAFSGSTPPPPSMGGQQPILYTIPQTGATIDINTVPESVIDQLLAGNPGSPQLLGKKQDFQKQAAATAPPPPPTALETYSGQINDLANKLPTQTNDAYKTAETSGIASLSDQQAQERSKLLAERAATGNLTSPTTDYATNNLDKNYALAKGNLIGGIETQKAGAQAGLSKTIGDILSGAYGQNLQNNQFNQNLGFQQNKLRSDINQANEDRGLQLKLNDANLRTQRDLQGNELNGPGAVIGQIGGITQAIGNLMPKKKGA